MKLSSRIGSVHEPVTIIGLVITHAFLLLDRLVVGLVSFSYHQIKLFGAHLKFCHEDGARVEGTLMVEVFFEIAVGALGRLL